MDAQATPKDKRAAVVIHNNVDRVMAMVMRELRLPVPPYIRTDALRVSHEIVRKHCIPLHTGVFSLRRLYAPLAQ